MDTQPQKDEPITLKIKNVTKQNEIEYAQYAYNKAIKIMLKEPSQKNIDAFLEANRKLLEVKDAYNIGARLLLERLVSGLF